MLKSLENGWINGSRTLPKIFVLEVRERTAPTGEAISWLIVERVEKYVTYPNESLVSKASIEISYHQLKAKHSFPPAEKGSFSGAYASTPNLVSLTSSIVESSGAVFLDLPGLNGQRIGTFMMSQIVEWTQQWPTASVKSIELLQGQAHGANKDRRNNFYERYGIQFEYIDSNRAVGCSKPMHVSDLNSVDTWRQNITIHTLVEYISNRILDEQVLNTELIRCENVIQDFKLENQYARTKLIMWVTKILFERYSSKIAIFLLSIFVVILSMAAMGL